MTLELQERCYDTFFSEKLATNKEGTRKGYTYALHDFEVFTKNKYKKDLEQMINEFRKAEIETIIDVLQSWVNQSKVEKRNKQLRLSLLNNYLYYRGVKIDPRDMKDVKFEHGEPEERRGISKEDLIKIVSASKKQGLRALILSLATSGMAIGEACHIKKRDIDLSGKRPKITIQRSYTKRNGRGRTVYISKEAAKAVRPILDQKKDNDFVYTNSNDPEQAKENEMARFRRLVDSLKLDGKYESGHREITLHALRAYFFTKATQVHGIAYAHKMTGHKGYLEEYNRYSEEKKLEMYLKLEPELYVFEVKPETEVIENMRKEIVESKEEMRRELNSTLEKTQSAERALEMAWKIIEASKKNPTLKKELNKVKYWE